MNRLAGYNSYIIGAMDRVADGGEGWRDYITPYLENLGIVVLNPCNKPIDIGLEDKQNRKEIEELKRVGDYDEVSSYDRRKIRSTDLRMVDMSQFVIVNLDLDVHPCGTYEELFWANRCKKPILVHMEQGKVNTPNWLLWTIPHQFIFDTWDDMLSYLKRVDDGTETETYNRWMFFDLRLQTLKSMLKVSPQDPEMMMLIEDFTRKNFNF